MDIRSYSLCGSHACNEDTTYFDHKLQVVIDGASGIDKDTLCPTCSDAAYLAYVMRDSLKAISYTDLDDLPRQLQQHVNTVITTPTAVSASLAATLLTPTTLELSLLGDCTVVVETVNGGIFSYQDVRVPLLDKEVLEKACTLSRRMDLPMKDMLPYVHGDLAANRGKMNTPDGYSVFDTRSDLTGLAKRVSLPRNQISRYMLMSDGWEAMVSLYKLFPDLGTMLRMCCKAHWAPDTLAEMMCKLSALDDTWDIYPRLKALDDHSCVIVEL